ncbi:leucine-rich repeat domain-containing protein [Brachyspira pilosicoli]|uniref:leucine-rich repeat domain-containing protein n=1 Tax=Brachyspira pilosicoli TaxID=52584 RepID=UPI0030070BDE
MLKRALFLFIIFIFIISCRRAVTRPTLDSLGTPPTEPDFPTIDENTEGDYIVKADDTEEEIANKIQKYYEQYQQYAVILEDTEENIKANGTIEKINTVINNDIYSQGVSLNLLLTDITEIKENAFKGNVNLISIEFPDTLTTIGNYAFNNCKNLIKINFPSALIDIGKGAFLSCKSLEEVNLKDTKINILSTQIFSDCSKLSAVTLPDILSGIENSAFAYCYSLKEINFPESLTTINVFAFTGCSFVKLVFNNGLTSINSMAFYNCSSLTQISFPSTLTKIDSWAFSGCGNLNDIEYNGDNPNIQAVNIFKSYAGSTETTPKQLYLPNVEAPNESSQDPNPWENFLDYDWVNKIQYKTNMPNN